MPKLRSTDPISYQIEALRMFLESKLGMDIFIQAYRFLQDARDGNMDVNVDMNEELTVWW